MGRSRPRRELDYAIESLASQRDMLLEMAPATDDYEGMMRRVRSLERAIVILQRPDFEVSPFV